MQHLTYQTLDGTSASLSPEEIDALSQGIRGGVLTATDEEYEQARSVWNGMVDHHPALIARCLGTQDVRHAVDFARTHRMLLSVRGGGHHIAGNAVADGALTIDLSAMRNVRVDPEKQTARVAAGALLGDVDHETQAFGLATPLGINSTTGVAGLCLGGGFGWLTRKLGMTVDNLISADIVTADGELRIVSATQEPELFWAIRGGGGNFGVVTSFEFQLHPIGPQVYAGLVVYPYAQAKEVLRAWRDFNAGAPRELSVWAVLRQAPPLPFLPESIHGKEVVVFALVYSGDPKQGERLAAKVLKFGEPAGSMLGTQPYAGFQTAFDPLLTPGARNYWKSHNFIEITDALIDMVIRGATSLPGPECEVFIAQLGGAAGEVAVTDTAYAGRDANFVMNVHGRWQAAEDDDKVRDWARGVFRDTAPFATGGGYINFLTEDEGNRVDSAYAQNYARLQQIKQQFDPENLFRINQNIAPAPLARTA
ncbi:FAD-linked oxidase [Litchfieldella qijiaojingensis]|uniref:FAD-linked oxidase n=1 Tax=Litchfieldella qijiaojingensis TaxID=980347 RepID=A0ABQ2YQZ2_9GAMM|nr:FAD-binding oxidoreductase [Halomonas qijiaojingensis]GGX89790.1 FAD-linked oxidase [Halomonas qijiaojingensis]